MQDTAGPAGFCGKLRVIQGEAGHGLGGGYACFPAICDGHLQCMLWVEPSKVHSVKPLFLPGLHNSTGRNPAGLLRPLRAEEAHEPALPGQAGHLRRCASGLEVDGGGKHLAGQGGVLVLDDLIGALEGLLTEVPRHHPQGGEHIHVLRLRTLPVKAVQRLGGDGIRPGDQLIELPDKFFFLHLLSLRFTLMCRPWTAHGRADPCRPAGVPGFSNPPAQSAPPPGTAG